MSGTLASWLGGLLGGPAPQPRGLLDDPTMTNPVGWSSVYPPQYLSNPDPNVSPVVSRGSMTDLAALGTLGRKGYVTVAELPAAEAKAKQALDYGMIAASASSPLGIRAFHGSPHTFDRFDLSKIGTGEGAQAYGHGLYFAGNEGVAKGYRQGLAGMDIRIGGMPWQEIDVPFEVQKYFQHKSSGRDVGEIDLKQIAAQLDFYANNAEKSARAMKGARFAQGRDAYLSMAGRQREGASWARANAEKAVTVEPKGSMYEVSLRTSPERLLDWDAPLSAQPAGVRDGATRTIQEYIDLFRANADPSIRNATRDAAVGVSRPEMTGAGVHEQLTRMLGGDRAAAANVLKSDAGIDGIQYLDAGSRAAGDGTRNYVMFDDKLIDILRRYGLLGMLGGGGAAGLLAPEAPQQ